MYETRDIFVYIPNVFYTDISQFAVYVSSCNEIFLFEAGNSIFPIT